MSDKFISALPTAQVELGATHPDQKGRSKHITVFTIPYVKKRRNKNPHLQIKGTSSLYKVEQLQGDEP